MDNIFVAITSLSVFVFISGAILLIIRKWVIRERGFLQVGFFAIGEITFFCNRGLPCNNCPLSMGICPIGTLQRFAFLRQFPLQVLLSCIFVIGLIGGTISCGWACPVGLVQDLLRTTGVREIKIHRGLTNLRYIALLLGVIAIILELHSRFFSSRGLGIFNEVILLGGGLFLTLGVFIKRPFCSILCPLGLLYGKLNRISPFKVFLDKKRCTGCRKCVQVCVTGINPVSQVNGDLCAKCFNCQKICSQKHASSKTHTL